MSQQVLADLVVVLHLAFIAFAAGGGLIVAVWPRVAWLHLPAVAWATLVELAGWVCPLTPLEQRLRAGAGAAAYGESFVDHYLVPVVYPAALTRELQWLLGVLLLFFNVAVYAWIWRRRAGPSR